ncbi:MAG TPA: CoA ester lyase [Chthoniobacterales bacterium]|jgi:(S)-citramalyl-CoA lyase|nr:CoA ester lyase [Chthoniobacterales bacterium]
MKSIIPWRSLLFTPANRRDLLGKAFRSGADAIILDLEDSVPPSEKAVSRQFVANWLQENSERADRIGVRMNGLRTIDGFYDVIALAEQSTMPGFIVLPKVESAAELQIIGTLLKQKSESCHSVALIESAAGLEMANIISNASIGLKALLFGAGDLASDLGAENSRHGLLYARSRVVQAAASAKIEAIDSPCFVLSDEETLRSELATALELGFTGKAAIHPKQIDAINQAFTPSPEAIDEAHQILAVAKNGVGIVNGKMVDIAMVRRAHRTLARCSPELLENDEKGPKQ